MKKILLTSGAALMLSAGYAAADVISFAGDARMGVRYDNLQDNEFSINSRIRGYFFFDAETDTGLEFGGRLRIDGAGLDAGGGTTASAAANYVYVASEFGEVRVGDVPGAGLAAVGDLHGVGFTGLGFEHEHAFFMRNFANSPGVRGGAFDTGGNAALYQYDLDAFSLYAHTGSIDDDNIDTNVGIGASYDMGMFSVGAAFEYADVGGAVNYGGVDADGDPLDPDLVFADGDATHIVVGGEVNLDMFSVRGSFGRAGGDIADFVPSRNQFGASVQGSFDAYTLTAFAREDFFEDRHFGVGASYDLGGGASIDGGVRHTRFDADVDNQTQADLGISMSF